MPLVIKRYKDSQFTKIVNLQRKTVRSSKVEAAIVSIKRFFFCKIDVFNMKGEYIFMFFKILNLIL